MLRPMRDRSFYATISTLSTLAQPQAGKLRLVSSQDASQQRDDGQSAAGEPNKMVTVAPAKPLCWGYCRRGEVVRIWMTTLTAPGEVQFQPLRAAALLWMRGQPSWRFRLEVFGVPWGIPILAEPLSCTSGGYNCQFPCPRDGCRIEVVNEAPVLGEPFFQIEYLS